MCKFHEDVARDVARRPDGTVDPVAFAINAVALGTNFSIGDYVTAMPGISGYNTYALASRFGQESFAQSGIVYDPNAFAIYQNETLPYLREKTRAVMETHPFDRPALKHLKKESQASNFINQAPDELYEPFDDLSPNVFKSQKHVATYQKLRLAAAAYWDDGQVQEILGERFKQSVAVTFDEAPQKASTVGLWMHEKLKPLKDTISHHTPQWMKKADSSVGRAGAVGCGNVLFHTIHYSAFPALGAAVPTLLSFGINGAFILGAEIWDKVSDHPMGKLGRMVLYGTALVGSLASAGLHKYHHGGHHEGHDETSSVTYFDDEAGRRFMVREDVLCGGRPVKDTVMPFFIHRSDTIQINSPVKTQTTSLTP